MVFFTKLKKKKTNSRYLEKPSANKQGQIHGWQSRVRVGRGSDEIDQLGSWAGAVTPKPPINVEKAKCHRPTDRQTDGQSGL